MTKDNPDFLPDSEKDIELTEIMQPLSINGSDDLDENKMTEAGGFSVLNGEDPDLDEIPKHHQVKDGFSWLPASWNEHLFPPSTPRPLQLSRKENIAVPFCYLVVGLLQG